MVVQNLKLYIGDKTAVASVDKPAIDPEPQRDMSVTFAASKRYVGTAGYFTASGNEFPKLLTSARATSASVTVVTQSMTIPDVPDRVLVVFVSGVRTDDEITAQPTITFNGDSLGSNLTSEFFVNGTTYATTVSYKLNNPDAVTGDLVVTFPGVETNIVVQAVVFSGATNYTSGSSLTTTGTGTSAQELNIGTAGTNYDMPIFYVYSETTTQTIGSGQISIQNSNNTYGTDSISYIGELPDFLDRTEFNLVSPERIQTMATFDIDILVGTRVVNSGRVLRWDGVSEGWAAQDDIEEQGINAFIRDDNFMYVQAGFYGRLYFYNGEKLEPFKRVYGDWLPTQTAKINPNAVAFHLGTPLFGLSNVAGNPVLQGVYGFGSYGTGYNKSLSLDFPIPTDAFSGVEIGCMVVDGADLYVAYKDATDEGVAKLDWSNKYENAYLETTALFSPKERSDYSNTQGFNADYVELPTDTNITFSYKKAYEASFATLSNTNIAKLKQIRARENITDIANLIVKVALTVNDNDSPIVENISIEADSSLYQVVFNEKQKTTKDNDN
jgi:hypothetical protein